MYWITPLMIGVFGDRQGLTRPLVDRRQALHQQISSMLPDANMVRRLTHRKMWQDYFHPSWSCMYDTLVGAGGDGSKWICDPHGLPSPCIVYSMGSRGDYSFERAIHSIKPECEIHTFDKDVQYNAPHFVRFHQEFITSLADTRRRLGHTRIDILKMDIEGSEFEALSGPLDNIGQIAVEVHAWNGNAAVADLFQHLHASGFAIFHKEPNIEWGGADCCCVEFSLVAIVPN